MPPAGGCLLTDPIYSRKLREVLDHEEGCDIKDLAFLRLGRHFRLNGRRFVFGRNKEENDHLEALLTAPYGLIRPKDFSGPSGIVKGEMEPSMLPLVAALLVAYSKESTRPVIFEEIRDGQTIEHAVEPADADISQYLIT